MAVHTGESLLPPANSYSLSLKRTLVNTMPLMSRVASLIPNSVRF